LHTNPEKIPEDSPAYKKGYKTISALGLDRIKKSITNLQHDLLEDKSLSFKSYFFSPSNFLHLDNVMREGKFTDKELFSEYKNVLVEGWKKENIFIEVELLQGFPLDSQVLPAFENLPNKISRVHSGFCAHDLYICLDEKIADQTADSLELRPEDIFVCLDSALTDQSKMRLSDRTNLKII